MAVRSAVLTRDDPHAGGDRRLVHVEPAAPLDDSIHLSPFARGTPCVAGGSLFHRESGVRALRRQFGVPEAPTTHFSTGSSAAPVLKPTSARRRGPIFMALGWSGKGHESLLGNCGLPASILGHAEDMRRAGAIDPGPRTQSSSLPIRPAVCLLLCLSGPFLLPPPSPLRLRARRSSPGRYPVRHQRRRGYPSPRSSP
jgi:hypothetical protein